MFFKFCRQLVVAQLSLLLSQHYISKRVVCQSQQLDRIIVPYFKLAEDKTVSAAKKGSSLHTADHEEFSLLYRAYCFSSRLFHQHMRL